MLNLVVLLQYNFELNFHLKILSLEDLVHNLNVFFCELTIRISMPDSRQRFDLSYLETNRLDDVIWSTLSGII